MNGLLGYYAVSLIVVPFVKGLLPGAAGTVVSCFVQIFYVVFLFPLVRQAPGAGGGRRLTFPRDYGTYHIAYP